jgi:hypothetical protein
MGGSYGLLDDLNQLDKKTMVLAPLDGAWRSRSRLDERGFHEDGSPSIVWATIVLARQPDGLAGR